MDDKRMFNKAKYDVYGTRSSIEDNPRRDWEWLGEETELPKAERLARNISTSRSWHEAEIRGIQRGETIHHSYWRDGEMFVNMLA